MDTSNDRVIGIDLLKIISMLFIVALHILGHGGALAKANTGSHIEYIVVWAIEILAMSGVNCFALASGFLSYSETSDIAKSYSKYIRYWIPVTFYCVLFTLLGATISGRLDLLQLAKAFIPVTSYQYWYFSCFTGLFFFIPFINAIVHKLDNSQLIFAAVISFLLFSFYATPARILWNAFSIQDGYSFLWLTCLYFYGSIVRKLRLYDRFSSFKLILAAVFCFLITLFWKCGFHYIGIQSGRVFFEKGSDLLLFYISPTVSGLAFILLLLSCKVDKGSLKYAPKLAGLTFGVYLINDNPIIRDTIFKDNFMFLIRNNFMLTGIYTIATIAVVYVLCLLIEAIRKLLFKILRLDNAMKWFSRKIYMLIVSCLIKFGM